MLLQVENLKALLEVEVSLGWDLDLASYLGLCDRRLDLTLFAFGLVLVWAD